MTENTLIRSNTGLKKDICILGLVKPQVSFFRLSDYNYLK